LLIVVCLVDGSWVALKELLSENWQMTLLFDADAVLVDYQDHHRG
jgi:hypothetical protein